ncbi:MAG: YggS family pyridoxal phosphate-dependent enzyme [Planctomycetota bacterium]
MSVSETLQKNLKSIRDSIAAACHGVGRHPCSVRLVAVTKYAEWEWVQELSRLHSTFGENRPQQLAERQALLPQVEWHLIGQLQRNKVKQALQHAAMIHSVDSLRLLQEIVKAAHGLKVRPSLLLQVNVSGEESKSGFASDELRSLWPEITEHVESVSIEGLMTMAPETDDLSIVRPVFAGLRMLRNELAAHPDSRQRRISLPELSMGMSGDYVPAIEEGATLVRIGSRVFAGL